MTQYFQQLIEHAPTKQAYETLLWIVKLYKPKRVLEIGSGATSTHAFCEGGVKEIVSIDIEGSHEGGNEAKEFGVKRAFIHGDSVVEIAGAKGKFDMVLIDGDHSRAHIDAWNALPKLKKKGILVFHDVYHDDEKYTTMLAFDDMIHRFKHFGYLLPYGVGYGVVLVDTKHET